MKQKYDEKTGLPIVNIVTQGQTSYAVQVEIESLFRKNARVVIRPKIGNVTEPPEEFLARNCNKIFLDVLKACAYFPNNKRYVRMKRQSTHTTFHGIPVSYDYVVVPLEGK